MLSPEHSPHNPETAPQPTNLGLPEGTLAPEDFPFISPGDIPSDADERARETHEQNRRELGLSVDDGNRDVDIQSPRKARYEHV